jgi:hypothetical protein
MGSRGRNDAEIAEGSRRGAAARPATRAGSPAAHAALGALLGVAVGCAALAASTAPAQSARPGVRIEYTAIATQGGLSGRAFLPLGASDVREVSGPRCPGAQQVEAIARSPRGAVRRIALSISGPTGVELPFDGPPCARSHVETELEGGQVLRGGRGRVIVEAVETEGDRRVLVGRFSQTAELEGTPTTLRGELRVPLPPAR